MACARAPGRRSCTATGACCRRCGRAESASLLISNIDRVGTGLNQLLVLATALVTLAGVGAAALAISPAVALGAAVGGVVVLLGYRGMRRRAAFIGERLTIAYGEVYARFSEGLGALRVIKSFGAEAQAAQRGTVAIADLRRAQFAFARDLGLGQIALQGAGSLLFALLVWFAMTRWGARSEQVLPLVALFARALPLLGIVQEAWQNWAHERPALAAARDMITATEAAREAEPACDRPAPGFTREIALRGVKVSFAGRDRPALAGVDLVLPARGITAIVGPSGAGKSTLADVLGGLISPDAGKVLIDGIVLDAGLRRAWRRQVTYVQQEAVLFTGTVRENLAWAAPAAGDEQLCDVLDQAAAGFVTVLPEGLDTLIGERGHQLSGGERQRLVLARALLREPRLLILDEAASALDRDNEAAIADAVARLGTRMAILVIGHRGALAELAERVVRLEAGRIVSG